MNDNNGIDFDEHSYQLAQLDKETHIKLRKVFLHFLKVELQLQDITVIGLLVDTLGYFVMEETKGNKKNIDMILGNIFRTLKANMHRVADKDSKHRLLKR